jgi:hypothetical protein
MIPKEFRQVGNILLVYNPDGFIPATIRKVMLLKANRKGINKDYTEGLGKEWPKRIYNHSELFVDRRHYIGEREGLITALKDGVNIRKYSSVVLPMTKKKFAVLVPKVSYTDWEKKKINDAAYDFVNSPHRYDFKSLGLWHIVAAFTDEWLGKTGKKAEKRMYCYEITGVCSNYSGREMFEHDHYIDFWDIWLNKNYELIWESD